MEIDKKIVLKLLKVLEELKKTTHGQNIEDLNVLAFTELPETRKINIIATIENKLQEENNK